jgi:hypothetical protein
VLEEGELDLEAVTARKAGVKAVDFLDSGHPLQARGLVVGVETTAAERD